MTFLFLEAEHAHELGLDFLISKMETPVSILYDHCDNSLRPCLYTLSTMTVVGTSDAQPLLLYTDLHSP